MSSSLESLDKLKDSHPELEEILENIRKLKLDSLWHEITLPLMNITEMSSFNEGGELIELFNNFIKGLETRINPLAYSQMAVNVSRQYKDMELAIKFMTGIKEGMKDHRSAELFCAIALAQFNLDKGDIFLAGEYVTDLGKTILKHPDIDVIVFSAYYKMGAKYYKTNNDHQNFYKFGLQYLAYTPEKFLSEGEKVQWSFDMGMAVLLGKNIYNITELLDRPLLKSLMQTEHVWLYDLLQTFNGGKITEFHKALEIYTSNINEYPILSQNLKQLELKVRILALVELIFSRQKGNRNLPFKLIAEVCQITVEEVELLAMKAMSLELIKGEIDQVDEVVRVNWVIPRVLDMERITNLNKRIVGWEDNVKQVLSLFEDQTGELLNTPN